MIEKYIYRFYRKVLEVYDMCALGGIMMVDIFWPTWDSNVVDYKYVIFITLNCFNVSKVV